MIFKQLREIFIFNRQERSGILVLLFILFLTLCVDIALPFILPENKYDVIAWKEEAAGQDSVNSLPELTDNSAFAGIVDPNHAGLAELTGMGIPSGLAGNWVKYLQKGGRFRKKEEVMKLYGMTDDLYQKIEEHLQIPEKASPARKKTATARPEPAETPAPVRKDNSWNSTDKELKKVPRLEVNKADSAQLEALPGIGPVLASRIIKFRRLLGGFYEIAQLMEIYGMTEELWIKSSARLLADPSEIKKMEINFLSPAELGRHPYIGYKQARKIVKQRDNHGKFTQMADLEPLFSADSLRHLAPYLSMRADEK